MRVAVLALLLVVVGAAVASAERRYRYAAGSGVHPNPQQPADPIIGIMTHPMSQCDALSPGPPAGIQTNMCIEGFYMQWLEAAGIRTVPFPWNASLADQKKLAMKVNGVLFMGGGLSGAQAEEFFGHVQHLFDWAVEWAVAGDPFFLWGTCQGFQMLASAAARTLSILEGPYHGMYPSMLPVNFTGAAASSAMYGGAPKSVLHNMAHKATTLNWHHLIVKASAFEAPGVAQLLTPLTTNLTPNGTEFISSFEGRVGNIMATQFHPERPPFEFSNDIISHSPETIGVSQYLATVVAARLRMNNHSFDSAEEAEAMMTAHWPSGYYGWGTVDYWIQYPNGTTK